jgi:hypothetical protein
VDGVLPTPLQDLVITGRDRHGLSKHSAGLPGVTLTTVPLGCAVNPLASRPGTTMSRKTQQPSGSHVLCQQSHDVSSMVPHETLGKDLPPLHLHGWKRLPRSARGKVCGGSALRGTPPCLISSDRTAMAPEAGRLLASSSPHPHPPPKCYI